MSALRQSESLPHSSQAENESLQRLSATLDGEADPAESSALLAELKEDETLSRAWAEFHLIGDLMRGEKPMSDGFMERLSAQLAAEPTVLAPRRSVWPQRIAVASFASLAVWGVISISGLSNDTPAPLPLAAMPGYQQAVMETERPAMSSQLAPYLVAHQEFAPMAVASPYQRAVEVVVERP